MLTWANNKRILLLLVLLNATLVSQSSIAGELATFSPDIHLDLNETTVADEESAYSKRGAIGMVGFGDLPDSADVDAVHGLPNGDVLFSLETSIVLGGQLYRPSDVIRFNGANWSKEFDGVAEGLPIGVNIDAIAMSGETLLFSIDIDATIGSASVNDADVIAFSGASFSVFLSAANSGIEHAADIDALHLDDQGRVLVSLDSAGTLGDIQYSDEDLLAWVSPNWLMEFDGSIDNASWQAVDLDAWSIVFFDDNIFMDSFETL